MVSVAEDDAVDFNRDVRPILTRNCTTCHGGVKKAGDVSYLYREDTLGKGESTPFLPSQTGSSMYSPR